MGLDYWNEFFTDFIYEDKNVITFNKHTVNKEVIKQRIIEEIKKLKN
jgi:hypothetical protein